MKILWGGNTCYLRSIHYHLCSYFKYLRYLLVAIYKDYFHSVFFFKLHFIYYVFVCGTWKPENILWESFSFCHVGPMPHTQATSAFTHRAISRPLKNTPRADGIWAARGSSISIISVCSECFELGSLWEADTF